MTETKFYKSFNIWCTGSYNEMSNWLWFFGREEQNMLHFGTS